MIQGKKLKVKDIPCKKNFQMKVWVYMLISDKLVLKAKFKT